MDEVVAVAVTLEDGATRYFLTHGRIFDPVDTAPIEAAVLKFASGCDLGGATANAEVAPRCRTHRRSRTSSRSSSR